MKNFLSFTALMMILISTATSQSDNPLWLRYPAISPDGKTIVFSYQGDLFKVPAEGGDAIPLTRHSAYDFSPVWSPGRKNHRLFHQLRETSTSSPYPANGGKAQRITDFSGTESPNSFTPDGEKFLLCLHPGCGQNQMFPSGVLSELCAVPGCGAAGSVLSRSPRKQRR